MLQTLGMPEAARHASAVLSLVPGHAALRSGDVGATLQQQQRLTSAIRAGTATLHLGKQPGISVEALALSSDLLQWATITHNRQTMTVVVYSRQGTVCQHTLSGSRKGSGPPVFNHDNSRLGVAFITAADPRLPTSSVALLSLTQPDQQPVIVETSSSLSAPHSIAAAPSADLFLVCTRSAKVVLSLLCGDGSCFERHEAPWGALVPAADDQQLLFSPCSRFLCLMGSTTMHCLAICTGVWHRRQRSPSKCLHTLWLQLPACMSMLLTEEQASLALIRAPLLATSHAQPLPSPPCKYNSLGLDLVSGIQTDCSMHIFRVLPGAPPGQPFLRLLSTLILSPEYCSWTTSPDACFLLLCHSASGSDKMQHIVVSDVQSAAEIRHHTLHLSGLVDKISWSGQGIGLRTGQGPNKNIFRAAHWLTCFVPL